MHTYIHIFHGSINMLQRKQDVEQAINVQNTGIPRLLTKFFPENAYENPAITSLTMMSVPFPFLSKLSAVLQDKKKNIQFLKLFLA